MDKKIWLETREQKIAAGLVIPAFAVGFCIPRDDRDRPRGSQGVPIEQPHDHHERAPIEATTLNTMAASGSSTASAITFSPVFFEAWESGEVEWPVILRPDLYITVERSDRQELADRATPRSHPIPPAVSGRPIGSQGTLLHMRSEPRIELNQSSALADDFRTLLLMRDGSEPIFQQFTA